MTEFQRGDIVKHSFVRQAREGYIKDIESDGSLHIEWYKWVNSDGSISIVNAHDPAKNIVLLHREDMEEAQETIEI